MKNNKLNGQKFYQVMDVKYYDSPNYFYAKILKSKELLKCEIYNIEEPSYLVNYPTWAIVGDYARTRPRLFNADIISQITEHTNVINEKIKDLMAQNKILQNKKQICTNKIEKYNNLLNKIKENNSYNFRKFKKTVKSYLSSLKDNLHSGYYELREVEEYQQALKTNIKLLKKLSKFKDRNDTNR